MWCCHIVQSCKNKRKIKEKKPDPFYDCTHFHTQFIVKKDKNHVVIVKNQDQMSSAELQYIRNEAHNRTYVPRICLYMERVFGFQRYYN